MGRIHFHLRHNRLKALRLRQLSSGATPTQARTIRGRSLMIGKRLTIWLSISKKQCTGGVDSFDSEEMDAAGDKRSAADTESDVDGATPSPLKKQKTTNRGLTSIKTPTVIETPVVELSAKAQRSKKTLPFDQDSIDDLKIVRGDDTGKLLELIIRESEEQESEFESESDVDYADYREKASRSQMAWTPRA
ncbi:MAG: hypothetical protein L6R38_009756, partial [Xanthoria sp. 2 TBL-2021]